MFNTILINRNNEKNTTHLHNPWHDCFTFWTRSKNFSCSNNYSCKSNKSVSDFDNVPFGVNTGIDYLFASKTHWQLGFGIGYQYSKIEMAKVAELRTDFTSRTDKVSILSVSLKSVYNFGQDFYLSLDPTFNFQLNYTSQQYLDNQTGLGLIVGVGKNIEIKKALFLNVEPRLWIDKTMTVAGLNLGLIFAHKHD